MPSIIDHETMNADDLPGVWSPVQWELTEDERVFELNNQAVASLMLSIDTPEAVLRMFLGETEIDRAFEPPTGYDPEQQGEWDESLITFAFRRRFKLIKAERTAELLHVEYKVEDLGVWGMDIAPENVEIYRL